MPDQLTRGDCEFLLECLKYTQLNYETTPYPSYDFKQEQFGRLDRVREKLRAIRDDAPSQ